MKFSESDLDGVYTIELEPIGDSRGSFSRFWCRRELEAQGLFFEIAQINSSYNATAGTVRGFHYQREPHAEAKIVACTTGKVFDVAVDARPDSPTYLNWFAAELSAKNNRLLYVPAGFAHGYQALEDDTAMLYLISEFYAPDSEGGFRYDDPAIGVNWPHEVTSVSNKDLRWPLVGDAP
jgi:dTDP-4-dehydrorhamnose 3,5-epimerase